MCGIHGFTWGDQHVVSKMVEESRVRGPDGHGTYVDEGISLGHNLLSIVADKYASKQPWILDDRWVLCYNGEVYNFKDLKRELRGLGEVFSGKTDTEVMAVGLRRYGLDFLRKVDGMYAVAWYDKKEKTLLLARDCAGTKPLYWTHTKKGIVFSSMIRSMFVHDEIERKLDMFGFKVYNRLAYIPGPKTMLRGVSKLYPGQVLKFEITSGKILLDTHVHDKIVTSRHPIDYEEFRNNVKQATKKCLMGHRDIGMFLSGGLDSSMILHEMSSMGKFKDSIRTYTTIFESYDGHDPLMKTNHVNSDAMVARILAKKYKTEHTEMLITKENFLLGYHEYMRAVEEPRGNKHTPVYYMLNERMAKDGIVVTISGDGGDELLTGYKKHIYYANQPWWPHDLDKIEMYGPFRDQGGYAWDGDLKEYLYSWFPADCLGDDWMNNQLFVETLTLLPEDFLIRNDKLGMNFSMEARFPLTTRSFRKYALSISSKYKYRKKEEKGLLNMKIAPRDAYRGRMPDEVVNKWKSGWSSPKEYNKSKEVRDHMKFIENKVGDIREMCRDKKILKEYGNPYGKCRSVFNMCLWADTFNITV